MKDKALKLKPFNVDTRMDTVLAGTKMSTKHTQVYVNVHYMMKIAMSVVIISAASNRKSNSY